LSAALEVPGSGDDVEGVVDGLAAMSALSKDLPVFDPGGDVFEAGVDRPVRPIVVVTDDPAVGFPAGTGDGGDSPVAAVAEDRPGRHHCGYRASKGQRL
jgi:hypothetical protein